MISDLKDIENWKSWNQDIFDDLFMFNVTNEFETKILIGATINLKNGYNLSEKVRPIIVNAISKVIQFANIKLDVDAIV